MAAPQPRPCTWSGSWPAERAGRALTSPGQLSRSMGLSPLSCSLTSFAGASRVTTEQWAALLHRAWLETRVRFIGAAVLFALLGVSTVLRARAAIAAWEWI